MVIIIRYIPVLNTSQVFLLNMFFFKSLFYFFKVRKPPDVLTPILDPNDPLADKDRERLEVEAMARRFESKYVSFLT